MDVKVLPSFIECFLEISFKDWIYPTTSNKSDTHVEVDVDFRHIRQFRSLPGQFLDLFFVWIARVREQYQLVKVIFEHFSADC